MRIVARVLGQLLLAIAGLWATYGTVMLAFHDHKAALGSAVLAGVFAVPGALLRSIAVTAERRLKAEALIRSRERFTIEDVARVLRSTPEQAHAFIAQQIAAHQLELAYQKDVPGYARRSSPPGARPPPPPLGPAPVSAPQAWAPCSTCGSTAVPTEAGFCPTCGARSEAERGPRVRA
ncbi:MAG TPA: hypothetical protein VND93_31405 [Myxococcales bacterium]|nr:hypothetical protein [Myxococcales bacterium]